MSTNTEVKNAMLSIDKTLVDENNLEIPPNSIIHCLGSLFQVTNAALRHIVVLLHCGCLSLNPFIEFIIRNNSSSSDVLYIQASISISPKYESK